MIQGNSNWTNGLAQAQKQPLYVLQVPSFALLLASFSAEANVTVGGYGVTVYGVGGYGT